MTFDEALAKAAAGLDVVREQFRQRFEQSLIDNRAADDLTAEQIDDLRAYEGEYAKAWRERTLARLRAKLLVTWGHGAVSGPGKMTSPIDNMASRVLVVEAFADLQNLLDVLAQRLARVGAAGPLNARQRAELSAAREGVTRLQAVFRTAGEQLTGATKGE